MALRFSLLLCATMLSACGGTGTAPQKPAGGFQPSQIAKTDVDRVAETHQREIFSNLKILTEKLYRRNPQELRKSGHTSVASGVARIFQGEHAWKFPELQGKRGADAIQLAFRDDYRGDRVLAFAAGLGSMVQIAFNDKTNSSCSTILTRRLYTTPREMSRSRSGSFRTRARFKATIFFCPMKAQDRSIT